MTIIIPIALIIALLVLIGRICYGEGCENGYGAGFGDGWASAHENPIPWEQAKKELFNEVD